MSNTAIVIPARLNSSRLDRKLLLDKTGKPLIQHTYEAAKRANIGDVYVATDNNEIKQAVLSFGGNVLMTGPCSSGTARVANAINQITTPGLEYVVNVQGDQPSFYPGILAKLVDKLSEFTISTLAVNTYNYAHINKSSTVKVVCDDNGRAMYFSRSVIPWSQSANTFVIKHIGIYAYRTSVLKSMCDNPNDYKPTEMSLSEDLEQLIWLQKGIPVGVVMTCNHCPSINTQEDYDNFVLEKTRGPGVWE